MRERERERDREIERKRIYQEGSQQLKYKYSINLPAIPVGPVLDMTGSVQGSIYFKSYVRSTFPIK